MHAYGDVIQRATPYLSVKDAGSDLRNTFDTPITPIRFTPLKHAGPEQLRHCREFHVLTVSDTHYAIPEMSRQASILRQKFVEHDADTIFSTLFCCGY